MDLVDYFSSFRGRIGRLAFFLGNLAIVIVTVVALLFMKPTIGAPLGSLPKSGARLSGLLGMLLGIVLLLWMSLALQIKRLHDLGLSGYWLLALVGVHMVLNAIDPSTKLSGQLGWLLLGCLTVLPGAADPNRHGPPAAGSTFGTTPADVSMATTGLPDPAQAIREPPVAARQSQAAPELAATHGSVPRVQAQRGFGRRGVPGRRA